MQSLPHTALKGKISNLVHDGARYAITISNLAAYHLVRDYMRSLKSVLEQVASSAQ